jgi:hypothetical protein
LVFVKLLPSLRAEAIATATGGHYKRYKQVNI